MSNKKKKKPENPTKKTQSSFNIDVLICIICSIIISLLFIPTFNRPWLIYDERIISEGMYFPSPITFGEIFEILSKFGFSFNTLSSNTIYSSNYITRTCPFGEILGMILNLFFGKNQILYHAFNLILHLINTCLVYFILKYYFPDSKEKTTLLMTQFIRTTLVLIWAVHPVMIEPVLLSTNFGAGFSYMFFFSFLLDFLYNRTNTKSALRNTLIPMLFLIPMLTNEYIITLPFVLFVISFYKAYQNSSFKKSLNISIDETKPYFIGFLIYVFYFLFISHYKVSHPIASGNQLLIFVERILWLAPQIFFHFIKLILYPKFLSIDQTLFVKLGNSLFDGYSIFCLIFLLIGLFTPLILFLTKRRFGNIFLLVWTFSLALLPFLHVLMPSYTLATERYLYAPLALLIIVIGKIISDRTSHRFTTTILLTLACVLVLCFVRSYYRTFDWKDNYSFINATYKTSQNTLFKAVRIGMLGKAIAVLEPDKKDEIRNYFLKSIELLEKAKEEILNNKLKYQEHLPEVIKSYGLDYDSLLAKVAFLEASSRCLELKEDYKIGLNILEPFAQNIESTDPRVLELYVNFLIQDRQYAKAKDILLKTNSIYPNTPFITNAIIDYLLKNEKDRKGAEKYLLETLKIHPYDTTILLKALAFYQESNNPILIAKYSYLYGLRTQSKAAYKQALSFYLDLKDFKNAKKTVNKLEKIAPGDPEVLFFISKYYYKTKDYRKALNSLINSYSIAKEINASQVLRFDITLTLAKLFLYLGDKEKAISLSQEIISLSKSDAESLRKAQLFLKSLGLN